MAEKQTDVSAGGGGGFAPLDGQTTGMPPPYSAPAPYRAGHEKMPNPPTMGGGEQQYQPGLHQLPVGLVPGQPGTTYVVNTGPLQTFNIGRTFGPDPTQGLCPSCGQCIVTQIDYEVGGHAQAMMCLFCVLGGLLCCWIPFCVPSMQDVVHSCPNCKLPLGRYNR